MSKENHKQKDSKKNRSTTFLCKPILIVILCTIFTSAGQVLLKIGSKNTGSLIDILTNIYLILGVCSYAVGAILLIIALKYGDLSLVYPFVALSFVWVTLLSILFFHETVGWINWLGILVIIIGVSLIGYGSKKWK